MNKIIKYLILAAAALTGLNACNQDNERAFYDESAPAAYTFLQKNVAAELTEDYNGTLSIIIARTRATEAATVGVKLTASAATESAINAIFSAPSQVSFAAGVSEAKVDVQFTLDDLGFGVQYQFSIEFANPDENLSIGGIKKTDVTVNRKLTWQPIGAGTWTDGLISNVFSVPALTYEVQVEATEEVEGLYRMVNPYGVGVYEYTEAQDVTKDPCYVIIDARNPNAVVIDEQSIGINYGYGEMTVFSLAYASRSGKTITFAARQLAIRLPAEGAFYAGACQLIVP